MHLRSRRDVDATQIYMYVDVSSIKSTIVNIDNERSLSLSLSVSALCLRSGFSAVHVLCFLLQLCSVSVSICLSVSVCLPVSLSMWVSWSWACFFFIFWLTFFFLCFFVVQLSSGAQMVPNPNACFNNGNRLHFVPSVNVPVCPVCPFELYFFFMRLFSCWGTVTLHKFTCTWFTKICVWWAFVLQNCLMLSLSIAQIKTKTWASVKHLEAIKMPFLHW